MKVYYSTLTETGQGLPFDGVLGQEIRKARIAAKLTQEELAAKASVSREYVNYVERGKRQPTVAVFIRLCKAMKIHPPEMLARVVGPSR